MTIPGEIAVVDDDDAVRDSIGALLRSHGFQSVAAFPDARSFLAAVEEGAQPACIICDVMMPAMTGLELQQELRSRNCGTPLVLISGHGHIRMAVSAIQAGAADFLEKPFDDAALIDAINRAVEAASRAQEAERQRAEIRRRIGELSQRQREVMQRVVQGLSSKEIAAELGISPRTVETYRLWIGEKMGARNLAELVRMVMLVDPPDRS